MADKACGDSYRLTFKTSLGRTWDDPWMLMPGPIDYAAWQSVAERATDKMWEGLERLGVIEQELGRGYPQYNAMNDAAAEIYNARNALPHPLFATPDSSAPTAVQVTKDAACLLEQIDKAILDYGRKPSTVKPTKSEEKKSGGGLFGIDFDGVMTLAVVVGIVVGAYYLDKSSGGGDE